MGNTKSENSIRNDKIMELRKSGYTLDKIGKLYGLSVSNVHKICSKTIDENTIAIRNEREKRNNSVYELLCKGYTVKYVSDLYGLTESNARQIYYKMIAKQNELYNYFKNIPLAEKDAKYLSRVLNKIGITTVNDFSNRDFRSFLTLIVGISKRGQALLIKVKYQESFRLYEFIKQNTEKSFIKHRLYFILVDSGVETLDDFCTFNLNCLYYLKGKADVTIGILKELQQKAKVLKSS